MIVTDSDILSSFAAAKSLPLLFQLKALLRLLWKKGVVSKAKVKTMIMRMSKMEGLIFKTTKEIFAD